MSSPILTPVPLNSLKRTATAEESPFAPVDASHSHIFQSSHSCILSLLLTPTQCSHLTVGRPHIPSIFSTLVYLSCQLTHTYSFLMHISVCCTLPPPPLYSTLVPLLDKPDLSYTFSLLSPSILFIPQPLLKQLISPA